MQLATVQCSMSVDRRVWWYRRSIEQGEDTAVHCSAVQCSAVQCSAVQCSVVQCSAVQCSAVQCSAVQCSAVQCILQCSTPVDTGEIGNIGPHQFLPPLKPHTHLCTLHYSTIELSNMYWMILYVNLLQPVAIFCIALSIIPPLKQHTLFCTLHYERRDLQWNIAWA